MAANLKNYTSEALPENSIQRIENKLVQAGATDISKQYDGGKCVAIRFRIMVNQTPVFFELPSKIQTCFKLLWANVPAAQRNSNKEAKVRQQAERTAWKLISDWVEIQISMIMLEQAELAQVFLPYAFNPAKNQTFYEQIKEGGYAALLTN